MRGIRPLLAASAFALAVTAVPGASGSAPLQNTQAANQADLPPVVWTCQTRPDIVADGPGPCPIDEMPGMKMNMVPVRLTSIWSCPVHTVVARPGPGKCPIDRIRDLIEVAVAMTWTCPSHPDIDRINPGTCPDGSPMAVKYARRPHGDHNPKHGGLYFMAPDNWHHLEGTYPEKGLFRLYLYDDYGRPLPPEAVGLAQARLVTKETFDSTTRATQEISAYPLTAAPQSGYLEARIDPLTFPAQVTAKVKFRKEGSEYRFDFAFADFTSEPLGSK
jgi:hypothetical protein